MKTKAKYLIIFLLISALSCQTEKGPEGTPACVEKLIKSFQADEVANPPAKIYSYTYQSRTVYYIPPRCCDIPSTLLDESCNVLCAPDGGIGGTGDGKCTDFFKERSNERLIWEDTRK